MQHTSIFRCFCKASSNLRSDFSMHC